MSIQSRLNRELYGPSLFEVTLGAALSILLGAVLAAGYLIFTPVKTLRADPKEGEVGRNEVVYIEGSKSPARSAQWMRKRQLLVEGQSGEISVVEDELNAWIADGAKPAPGADAPAPAFLQPTSVNFRIRGGELQVGVPASLNAFGYAKDVIFQMRGTFAQDGDRHVFVPSESHLGSLALHRLPAVEGFIIGALARTQSAAEEVSAAWGRVSAVSIEDNALKLTLR
jgi:hypothetical protein